MIPREDLLKKLDGLLGEPLYTLHDDFGRLQRSLLKHRDSIFRFLSNPAIPYDNNASERSLRLFKIKQKISGCFRSDKGADTYAQLLSIADTSKKNGKSRFQALRLIARIARVAREWEPKNLLCTCLVQGTKSEFRIYLWIGSKEMTELWLIWVTTIPDARSYYYIPNSTQIWGDRRRYLNSYSLFVIVVGWPLW